MQPNSANVSAAWQTDEWCKAPVGTEHEIGHFWQVRVTTPRYLRCLAISILHVLQLKFLCLSKRIMLKFSSHDFVMENVQQCSHNLFKNILKWIKKRLVLIALRREWQSKTEPCVHAYLKEFQQNSMSPNMVLICEDIDMVFAAGVVLCVDLLPHKPYGPIQGDTKIHKSLCLKLMAHQICDFKR